MSEVRARVQTPHIGAPNPRRFTVANDHGPSVKDDKQYEGLRKQGMS